MKLVMATFPDEPAALADWIEQQLVGLDLEALVAELLAVHGDTPGPSLEFVLGEYRSAVLSSGLKVLPADRLGLFLSHPRLLLDLQECVLTDGKAYWETMPRPAELTARVQAGWRKFASSLPGMAGPIAPSLPWYRQAWFGCVATAACLLVALGLWQWFGLLLSPWPPGAGRNPAL